MATPPATPPAAFPAFRRRKWLIRAVIAAAACALFYFVPLFHVVPLKAARLESSGAAFHADAFVETFWNERLLKASDRAVDVNLLFAAIRQNRAAAGKKYGHSLGLGSSYYCFVSGRGRVLRVKDNLVSLSLEKGGATPDVLIDTGPVFGDAVRDGSGLLNVSDYPNSQDFNAISSELDRRVEERVLPILRRKAVAGAWIHFVGFVEITDEEAPVRPMHLVPIIVEVT